jgi:hypothetical protein
MRRRPLLRVVGRKEKKEKRKKKKNKAPNLNSPLALASKQAALAITLHHATATTRSAHCLRVD